MPNVAHVWKRAGGADSDSSGRFRCPVCASVGVGRLSGTCGFNCTGKGAIKSLKRRKLSRLDCTHFEFVFFELTAWEVMLN